jgi:hypothetical protein
VLHLYPDVYNRNANTIENLRAELQTGGVDPSKLDDQTLRQMMDRVSMAEEFVVSVADIKASRALIAGRNQPLTEQSVKEKPTQGPRRKREKPLRARCGIVNKELCPVRRDQSPLKHGRKIEFDIILSEAA